MASAVLWQEWDSARAIACRPHTCDEGWHASARRPELLRWRKAHRSRSLTITQGAVSARCLFRGVDDIQMARSAFVRRESLDRVVDRIL